MQLLILVIMMGALYAFMIVPQQRRLKAHNALLSSLEEGDVVVTNSGIHGAVAEVEDKVVWLEVAPNVELKVSKGSIAERVSEPQDTDESDDDDIYEDDSALDEAEEDA